MSVIIRLQRLPWSANAGDVRDFFRGLHIPDGGVHIVGGPEGDAFIAFSSDEDARIAMDMNNRPLKENRVKLTLSSRVQMQEVIDKARSQFVQQQEQPLSKDPPRRKRSRSRSNSVERTGRRRSSRSESRERTDIPQPFRAQDKPAIAQHSPPVITSAPTPPQHQIAPTAYGENAYVGYMSSAPRDSAPPPPFTGYQAVVQSPAHAEPFGDRPLSHSAHGARMASYNSSTAANILDEHDDGIPGEYERGGYNASLALADEAIRALHGDRRDGPARFVGPTTVNSRPKLGSAYNMPEHSPFERGPRPGMPPHTDSDNHANNVAQQGGAEQPLFQTGLASGSANNGAGPHSMMPVFPGPSRAPMRQPLFNHPPQQGAFGSVLPRGPMMTGPPAPRSRRPLLATPGDSAKMPGDHLPGAIPSVMDLQGVPQPQSDFQLPMGRNKPSLLGNPAMRPILHVPPSIHYGTTEDRADLLDSQPPQYNKQTLIADTAGRPVVQSDTDILQRSVIPVTSADVDSLPHSPCVMLLNLPVESQRYTAIREFFRPLVIPGRASIKLIYNDRAEKTGEAFVRFASLEDCQKALRLDERQGIRVQLCSENAFEQARDGPPEQYAAPLEPRSRNSAQEAGPTTGATGERRVEATDDSYIVRLENVPYNVDETRLMEPHAFPGVHVVLASVERHRRDGKPTGRAYLQVPTVEDVEAALQSNGERFYGRKIFIRNSNAGEMERSTGVVPIALSKTDAQPRSRPSPPATQRSVAAQEFEQTCVEVNGLPYSVREADLEGFFDGLQIVPNGIRVMKYPRGSAYVEFAAADDIRHALKRNRDYLGSRSVTVKACTRQEMLEAVRRQFEHTATEGTTGGFNLFDPRLTSASRRNSSGTSQTGASTLHEDLPPIDPAVVHSIGSAPGCIIGVNNLPASITLEGILQFLEGFTVDENTVRMYYSESGEPTGNCLLAVGNPDEARRAVDRLNGRHLEGRIVRVFGVSL